MRYFFGSAKRSECIQISVGAQKDRGIYLRELNSTAQASSHVVTVTPVFHENFDKRAQVTFEKRVTLHNTEDWIQIPDFLVFNGGKLVKYLSR